MSETTIDTKTINELAGRPLALPIFEAQAIALPPGWTKEVIKQDVRELPAPKRTNRVVKAHELDGFISYVNRFKNEATALYCESYRQPALTARLDDHQPSKPSHVEHLAHFACPTTEEWNRWAGGDRKQTSQVEFAEFIEDNIRDVVAPTGIEFLTAITNFTDTRTVEFKSAQRLSDGTVQFSYNEKETAEQIRLPVEFQIAVPVFEGLTTNYKFKARLKYRLKDAKLTLWYELDRPDLVKREAYSDLIKIVEEQTSHHVHRAI